jgi:cytochrome P450
MYDSMSDIKYWKEPESFIPERFDRESDYYKQPNGEKRSTAAFMPFLVGNRSCFGQ